MNIKRTIAAILAFLALASFAGCKGEERQFDFNLGRSCRCPSI